jgi:hypothetical protein
MSQQTSPRQRGPGAGTVLGAVAALLAATFCFVGCLTAISALGSEHEAPTAALIAAAAVFAVAAVVLLRVAIRLEHRFRPAQPAARATPAAAPRTPARRPRNSPASRIAGIVIVIGAAAVLTTITVSLHSQAARSSYTQHHGLARKATIEAVQPVSHSTSHDSWTTYDYDLALAVSAGAATRTVAHDPTRDFRRYDQGDTISVLVDPRQLGYAELPGIPVESSSWFIGPLVLAVIFIGLLVLITAEEIRHRRLRSTQARGRSGAPLAGPPATAATSDPAESPQ